MSDARKLMIKSIKELLVPILREKNFKGMFPHFFRKRKDHIDLLTFQFNRYGGSFVVETSYADKERKNIFPSYKNLPAEKLRSQLAKERFRLGSQPEKGSPDHWFKYDEKNFFSFDDIYQTTAKEVIPYLKYQAEKWWRSKYIS